MHALYQAAGLSLRADLLTLNKAARVKADPSAVRYLAKYISFTGKITIPVLSMHTVGDGLVIPQNEQAYASVVRKAGRSFLLRQVFVSRGQAPAAPDADRPLAGWRAHSGQHEQGGSGARPGLQHLPQ